MVATWYVRACVHAHTLTDVRMEATSLQEANSFYSHPSPVPK